LRWWLMVGPVTENPLAISSHGVAGSKLGPLDRVLPEAVRS